MTNSILLSTDFKVGDLVAPKVNEYYDDDSRLFYIVTGYDILGVDETGQVTTYFVKAVGQLGELIYFPPETIDKKPV